MAPGVHSQPKEYGLEGLLGGLVRCEAAPLEVAIVQRVLGVGELVEVGGDSNFSLDRITVVVGSDLEPEVAGTTG